MKMPSDILELLEKIQQEEVFQKDFLHLTANENVMSPSIQEVLDSSLHNRYNLGHLFEREQHDFIIKNDFTFAGLQHIYPIERKAHTSLCKLFHAAFCDFRPLSGLHALVCVISTMTEPGDVIYCLDPNFGGHSATNQMLKNIGRHVKYLPVNDNLEIDFEKLKKVFSKTYPKAILIDHADPLYSFNIGRLKKELNNDVLVLYDASHLLGLIGGNQFENPFENNADVILGNTHKTFPGPQKAIILYKNLEQGISTSKKIGQSMVSSQHTSNSIALYLTVLEMELFGKKYAEQILKNSNSFSRELENLGFKLYRRIDEHTKTHIIFIDTLETNRLHPIEASKKLFHSKITSNARATYNRKLLRIGVQEITRLGLVEEDMQQLALAFKYLLKDGRSDYACPIIDDLIIKQKISYSIDSDSGRQ